MKLKDLIKPGIRMLLTGGGSSGPSMGMPGMGGGGSNMLAELWDGAQAEEDKRKNKQHDLDVAYAYGAGMKGAFSPSAIKALLGSEDANTTEPGFNIFGYAEGY